MRGVAGSVLLFSMSVSALSETVFPPDPPVPTTARDCAILVDEYSSVMRKLYAAYDAVGWGRGRQVHAGACCREEAAAQSWCVTFESHAPAWEAIHCAQLEQRRALNRCKANIVAVSARNFFTEQHYYAVVKYRTMKEDIDLLRSWAKIRDLSSIDVSELAHRTAIRGVRRPLFPWDKDSYAFRDPVIRSIVRENLEASERFERQALSSLAKVEQTLQDLGNPGSASTSGGPPRTAGTASSSESSAEGSELCSNGKPPGTYVKEGLVWRVCDPSQIPPRKR